MDQPMRRTGWEIIPRTRNHSMLHQGNVSKYFRLLSMIQEVHKVTSARYSQEDPRDIVYIIQNMPLGAGNQPCWQTALLATALLTNLLLKLLANCPAGKLPCWQLTSETAGKRPLLANGPCWQTALLANCPAGKTRSRNSRPLRTLSKAELICRRPNFRRHQVLRTKVCLRQRK